MTSYMKCTTVILTLAFQTTLSVYETLVLICSMKSPQYTYKYSKKTYSIVIFLPPVLTYQKCEISLLVGTKPRDQKQEIGNDCDVISGHLVRGKHIHRSFSYCELINLLRNGTIVRCL